MTKEIKWIAIQPLTGGMYFGTEEVVGKPAECILSFSGLADYKINKSTNEITGASNERHLIEYLKEHNRMPNYYIFKDKKMFQDDLIDNITFTDIDGNDEVVEFNDIDLVVAVPVCSGLSSATIAPGDTKNARNCNMKFIARYTMNVIKPKVLIMENAPQLYTPTGSNMREYFKTIASSAGYSVMFIRTDTLLHNNCQRRPRTFVMFVRNDNGQGFPDMINENKHIDVITFFKEIDKHIKKHTLQDKNSNWGSYLMLQWFKEMWGDEWRNNMGEYSIGSMNIVNRNLYDEYKNYINEHIEDEKKRKGYHRILDHVKYKVSLGKGFYWDTPILPKPTHTPAMIFKTIPHVLHPIEDRFISIEEALSLMGMPYDFMFVGNPMNSLPQIGQNVPVKTAAWVVSNAVNIINNWDNLDLKHSSVCYYNNIKNTYVEE